MELLDYKSIIDLNKMCRFCLAEIGVLYDLKTTFINADEKRTSILDLLNRIVEFPIKYGSQPLKICSNCIYAAAEMFKLKLQCDSSCYLVKEYINNNFVKEQIIVKPTEKNIDSNQSLDYKIIIDLDKMCRLCLAENEVLYDLKTTFINSDGKSISVLELLNRVVESPVKLYSQSPKICSDCISATAEMFKFNLQCDSSSFLVKECFNNHFVKEQIIIKPIDVVDSDKSSFENISEDLDYKTSAIDLNLSNVIKLDESENREQSGCYERFEPVVYSSICEFCGKLCKTAHGLKRHVVHHQRDDLFLCSICGKGFTEKRCLANHLNTHCVKKDYTCEDCGQHFRMIRYLKVHQRIHSSVRSYLCMVCGKSFRQFTSLTYHMRTHTQKRPFACEVCDNRFQIYGHYRTHKLVHTGERPFSCEVCGKGFTKKFDLVRHVSLVHSRTKDFLCNICNEQFACEIYLRHHMMKHTQQWSHVCPICKKGLKI